MSYMSNYFVMTEFHQSGRNVATTLSESTALAVCHHLAVPLNVHIYQETDQLHS